MAQPCLQPLLLSPGRPGLSGYRSQEKKQRETRQQRKAAGGKLGPIRPQTSMWSGCARGAHSTSSGCQGPGFRNLSGSPQTRPTTVPRALGSCRPAEGRPVPLCSQVIRGLGAKATAIPNTMARAASSPPTGAHILAHCRAGPGSKRLWAGGLPWGSRRTLLRA